MPLELTVAAAASVVSVVQLGSPAEGQTPPLGAALSRVSVCVASPEPPSPKSVRPMFAEPVDEYPGTEVKLPPLGAVLSSATVIALPAPAVPTPFVAVTFW